MVLLVIAIVKPDSIVKGVVTTDGIGEAVPRDGPMVL